MLQINVFVAGRSVRFCHKSDTASDESDKIAKTMV